MDDRLTELVRMFRLSDGGFRDADPPLNPTWATGWKVKTMIELLPHLYEPRKTNPRSSYGLKHEVEHLFKDHAPELSSVHTNWVGNGELILAMAYLNYPTHSVSGPNAYYCLRDKRAGKNNKGGKKKREADETEAFVRAFLRKKVAEHTQ